MSKLRTSHDIMKDLCGEKHGCSYGYVAQHTGMSRANVMRVFKGDRGLGEEPYRRLLAFAESEGVPINFGVSREVEARDTSG